MREEYIEEIERLKEKMLKAEAFAKNLPFFSEQIIRDKLTGEDRWMNFGDRYKEMPFIRAIYRGLFTDGVGRKVTNYTERHYSKFLFCIHVNVYWLFGHHAIRVDEVVDKVNLFFYDKINSTFYATDEQVMDLLEGIYKWYIKAKNENRKFLAKKKKKDAEKKLKEAQVELDYLNLKYKEEIG